MIGAIERPDSLVQQVLSALRKEIDEGRFAASSRLPAENVLAGQLGVSRPVVREAISQLKADGVLTTRKGSGAYIAENPSGNVFRLPPPDRTDGTLDHLFELRFCTEVAAAEIAALRRTPQDLANMRAAIENMQSNSADFKSASAADVELHHAIAAATHNPYLVAFADFVSAQLLQARAMAWQNSANLSGGPSPAHFEHQAIFHAIEARDPVAARAAAQSHLSAAAGRLRSDIVDSAGVESRDADVARQSRSGSTVQKP